MFEPVRKWGEEPSSANADQLFDLIPSKAKQCVTWRRENGAVSSSGGIDKATAEAVVKCCWGVKGTADM
eukprot:5034040-Pyramimonas_sp.AAC.1